MKAVKLQKDVLYSVITHTDHELAYLTYYISEDLLYEKSTFNNLFNNLRNQIRTNAYRVDRSNNQLIIGHIWDEDDLDYDNQVVKIEKNKLLELVLAIQEIAKNSPPTLLVIKEKNSFKVTDQIAVTPQAKKKYVNSLNDKTIYMNIFNLHANHFRNYTLFTHGYGTRYIRDNNSHNEFLNLFCTIFDNEYALLPEIKSELLNPESNGLIGNFIDITKHDEIVTIDQLYVTDPLQYRITLPQQMLLDLIETWFALSQQKAPVIMIKKDGDKITIAGMTKEEAEALDEAKSFSSI